ncbi:MAG: site-specific integrase [Nitrospiraceae bacterium]
MGIIVRQRKDKTGWWAFVHHQRKRLKRRFETERDARKFAELLSAQLKLSEFNGEASPLSDNNRQMPTVETYLTDWLHTYAEVHCKSTTAHGYRVMIVRHLLPVFGSRKLDEVSRADIKRLIADLSGKGLKKQTIHNILTPFKEAYHHAMDEGIVSSNPVARTGRLTHSREDRRLHMSPLDAEEVKALLQHARETVPSLYAILLCAVRTGLRQGELIGLQWSDIDFRSGFLEVRRAVVKRQLTSTKNHKLRRVDMSPQLIDALRHMREIRELESMSGKPVSEWVFVTSSNTRWDDSNLRHAFIKLLRTAGIRRVRFHDLRHTYVSLMAQQGSPPKYIQEQCGHSSIQVTMDRYAHLFPSGNKEWSAKLDDVQTSIVAPQTHPQGSGAGK